MEKDLEYYLNLNWTLKEGEDLDFEGKPYHYIMIEEIPSFCFCAKTIEKARENCGITGRIRLLPIPYSDGKTTTSIILKSSSP